MKREFKYPYVQMTADGVIQNIAMFDNFEEANVITRASYGNEAFALAYNYAVGIGDVFKNGIFYVVEDDGTLTEAEYIPNDEENIRLHEAQLSEMTDYQAEMLYELSLMQLGITE